MIHETHGKIEKLDAVFSAKAMFPLAAVDSIDVLMLSTGKLSYPMWMHNWA